MTEREQTEHFVTELDKLIDRFCHEYDLTYAAMVGCLCIKASQLSMDTKPEVEGDE